MFEHTEADAIACVGDAMRLAQECWVIHEVGIKRERKEEKQGHVERWVKPKWGQIKINVDAAFMHGSMAAAIGIVGRDWEGRFQGGIGKLVKVDSAFQAECLAIVEALEGRVMWGGDKIIVETDCKVLYDMIKSKEVKGCEWQCVDLVKRCIQLLEQEEFGSWEMALVARAGNKAADCVAAEVMRRLVPEGWLSRPPPSLSAMMARDRETAQKEEMGRTGIG